MTDPSVTGLITAAGTSTRMGGFPKPLLTIDGQYFVERLIEQYDAAGVDEILVVLGYEADEVRERADLSGATVVENEDYESGMLSSVRAGVGEAREDTDGILLSPVDYPLIPAAVIRAVADAFAADRSADVIQPTTDGERGHPPLFAASTFDALLHDPATEEMGARAVVYAEDTDTREVAVGDERVFVDIDTPAEYWDAVKNYT